MPVFGIMDEHRNKACLLFESCPAEISWKDFFGSSLSLAPTLISVYDELSVNSNKTSFGDDEGEAVSLASDMNGVTSQDMTAGFSSGTKSRVLERLAENNKSAEDEKNNGFFPENQVEIECDFSTSETPTACSTPVSRTNVASASATTLIRTNLTVEDDDKQRPLSITSTSSSSSSSSSLSCKRRKRLASCTTMTPPCSAARSASMVASGDETFSDSLATVSEVSSGDCSCQGPCCRASDDGGISYCVDKQDNKLFQRERFRSFSGCTAQTPPESIWCKMLPYAKSDTDVVSLRTADDVEDIDTGQMLGNSEEDTAVPLQDSPYIDRVVMEILETERTYVSDLKDIIEGYVDYLKTSEEFDLQSNEQDILFGNIQDIYAFNRKFLKMLEEFGHDPIGVAECFVNQTEGFTIYSEYCTNYPRSMETLADCMKEPIKAAILKGQQMALRHALPLGSYLLKPVQRILKYRLLLLNILNHHEATCTGHDTIQQAVESMTAMARHINDMKQRHEQAIRTQEIQSMLYGWDGADLTTLGDLVLEDKFRMCGAKAQRSVFLFEKAVLIAKWKEDGSLMVKAFIMCCNLMLIESVPKEPLCFHMIPFDCPRIQYTVQARNLEQKRLWCQHLKQLILDNYTAAIPEKAKELVMTLGKSREEEMLGSSMENVDYVRKQHSAPQYLQRSRGRRKSAGLIFDFKLKPRGGPKKSDSSSQSNSPTRLQIRRNSDTSEFLGEALKNREKSGHSPRLGLMKKTFFWFKDGSENSTLTLNSSMNNIKRSLAAHSTDAVCSYGVANSNCDLDKSFLEVTESRSPDSPANFQFPKCRRELLSPIRSTNIAHKDSFAIMKTKYASSSGTLNNKELCRKQCFRTRSKSTAGLDHQQEFQPSRSFDGQKDDCGGAEERAGKTDQKRRRDSEKPSNTLRLFVTSEDNVRTDLLADQQCDGGKSQLQCVDDVRNDKYKNQGCFDDVSDNSGCQMELEVSDYENPWVQDDTASARTPSEAWLCLKCGNSIPASEPDEVSLPSIQIVEETSPLLCLECASQQLATEMKELDQLPSFHLSRDEDDGNGRDSSLFECRKELVVSESELCLKRENHDFQFGDDSSLSTVKQVDETAAVSLKLPTGLANRKHAQNDAMENTNSEMLTSSTLPSTGWNDCGVSKTPNLTLDAQPNNCCLETQTQAVANDSKACQETVEENANGIVDSLRNTVAHFWSRFNKNNLTDSVDAKCAAGGQRTNSTSEEADCGGGGGEGSTSPPAQHSKDARYRFVYYLARAYSNRMKQLELKPEMNNSSNNEKLKPDKSRYPQVMMLSNSDVIGERMAQATPHTLDRTLSLAPCRRKGKRKGRGEKTEGVKQPSTEQNNVDRDGSSSNREINDQRRSENSKDCDRMFKNKQSEDVKSINSSKSDGVFLHELVTRRGRLESEEETTAFESFYEQQLSLDLEDGSLPVGGTPAAVNCNERREVQLSVAL